MIPIVPVVIIFGVMALVAYNAYKIGQANVLKRVKRIVNEHHTDDVGMIVVGQLEIELGIREAPKPPTGEYDA